MDMKSPVDGMILEKTLPLKLEVKPADLLAVRLGEDVLWEAGTPPGETLLIEKDSIPLKDGKAVLEFSLRSRPEPVRIEFSKVPEVRLQPRSATSGPRKAP
jgi:hypothetical protein